MKMDRTVKLLLMIIVVLLAALVARPLIPATPLARAASTATSTINNAADTTTSDQANVIGVRSVLASIIKIPDSDKVRNVQVVDSAHCFVVQYDNRFEVYWLDNVIPRAGTTTLRVK